MPTVNQRENFRESQQLLQELTASKDYWTVIVVDPIGEVLAHKLMLEYYRNGWHGYVVLLALGGIRFGLFAKRVCPRAKLQELIGLVTSCENPDTGREDVIVVSGPGAAEEAQRGLAILNGHDSQRN